MGVVGVVVDGVAVVVGRVTVGNVLCRWSWRRLRWWWYPTVVVLTAEYISPPNPTMGHAPFARNTEVVSQTTQTKREHTIPRLVWAPVFAPSYEWNMSPCTCVGRGLPVRRFCAAPRTKVDFRFVYCICNSLPAYPCDPHFPAHPPPLQRLTILDYGRTQGAQRRSKFRYVWRRGAAIRG